MIKTVDIVGSEVKVEDLGGQNVAVKNLGSGSIYVSTQPNITAGMDNVIEIPAGAGEVVLDANGTVYIVGTGKVQCTGTPYAVPNFKLPSSSSGGGGGTSDVTKEYVDAQDATNLSLAKSYTDNAKSEIQTTIDTVNDTLNTHIADQVKHITAEERTAWNAVNYSNPNLLINPDFAVNQRGLASYSYSSSGYTVDRWKISNAKLTVNDGFITLENTTEKATATFYQVVEKPAALSGKTVTLSFDYDLKTEGAFMSVQALTNGSWNPSPAVPLTDTGRNVKSTVITLPENLTDLKLELVIHSTDSAPFAIVDIYGAKLELGSIATPIIPADPATELAKCQRYYQIRSTNDIDPVDLRPSMRATPTDIKKVTGGYAYVAEF